MRILLKVLVLGLITMVFAGCLFSLPSTGRTNPPPPSDAALAEHLPGEVLVRLADGADANAIAEAVGGSVGVSALEGFVRIKLPDGAGLSASIAALEQQADVTYAEPVYIYRIPVEGTARTVTLRATDYYASQWGPEHIGVDQVWALNPNCGGVTVGLVDTGIDTENPEFAGRIDATTSCVAGEPAEDEEGHGTHVAGIIGAAHGTENGIKGLAGDVRFVSARVLGHDGGTNDEVAAGIRWAADRAKVINLSLGGWGRSQAIQDAVDYALGKGVVVVAAMGNGYRYGTSHYPAACEGVIAVGATNPDGTKADFSSEGPYISVAAPGVDILSCVPAPAFYATWSGTSMATPHVTGLVALLLSKASGATPAQIRTVLEQTTRTSPSWDQRLGWGEIKAKAAYDAFDGSYAAKYKCLTVTVRQGVTPVGGAEVLIKSGTTTITSSRTSSDVDDLGKAHFFYLRMPGSYTVHVRLGSQTASASVTLSPGPPDPAAVTVDFP